MKAASIPAGRDHADHEPDVVRADGARFRGRSGGEDRVEARRTGGVVDGNVNDDEVGDQQPEHVFPDVSSLDHQPGRAPVDS